MATEIRHLELSHGAPTPSYCASLAAVPKADSHYFIGGGLSFGIWFQGGPENSGETIVQFIQLPEEARPQTTILKSQ